MATITVTIETDEVLLVLGVLDRAILEGENNLADAVDLSSRDRTFTLNNLDTLKRLVKQIKENAP